MAALSSTNLDQVEQKTGIQKAAVKAEYRLGFWSAAITAVMCALFFVSLVIRSLNLSYLSSFLLAPVFVAMMVSIHQTAGAEKKVWSQLGLAYAAIYAVLCSLTYYVQLTVINNNPLQMAPDTLQPFVFIPGTPIFAQDMLGYAFMCAATISAGFSFEGSKLARWIKWLFITNALFLPALVIPALPLPVNQSGTSIGDQIGTYSNMVWSAYFTLASGLAALYFRRLVSDNQVRAAM